MQPTADPLTFSARLNAVALTNATYDMSDAPTSIPRIGAIEKSPPVAPKKRRWYNRFSVWIATPIALLLLVTLVVILCVVSLTTKSSLEDNWLLIHNRAVQYADTQTRFHR
ncbi:hypothetical protein, conserved [Angomonas deanei]|uniref:Uncharacterized protein n=1 Tax=Angomonas deanei TaxID=59799 RepID=A0A7G2C437_9TRYP|nr:hypothetical protein, conserved [Angomonas deanei]